jgi:hypothetical protein
MQVADNGELKLPPLYLLALPTVSASKNSSTLGRSQAIQLWRRQLSMLRFTDGYTKWIASAIHAVSSNGCHSEGGFPNSGVRGKAPQQNLDAR